MIQRIGSLAARAVLAALIGSVLLGIADAHAQSASVSGYVRDATTGETLLLANVVLAGTTLGAATNNAGYYTLTGIEPGTYTLVVSYLGYDRVREEVTLEPGESRRLDIEMTPVEATMEGITVIGEGEDEDVQAVGVTRMPTALIKQLPTVLEPDLFRSLQLLPGIKAASDFSSGLYIRGGSPDQTLILLDRTTVYNPSHFFGLFSTFNPDAIKDVQVYKGGYPAEYGGRLGSVVDIYNKDGNRQETEGGLSVGLLASRAYVEGPYSQGSYMVAVRRSTIEPLLSALRSADVDGIPDGFYFYDINGKLNFDAGPDDKLSLAFYAGQDQLDLPFLDDATFDIGYGNRTLSANWTHLFSSTVFANLTLTGSRYQSDPVARISGTEFSLDNSVTDVSAKADVEYIPNERHTLEAGVWAGTLNFELRETFDGDETFQRDIASGYASLYVQDTFRPRPDLEVKLGLRGNYFGSGDFFRLEPRTSVEYTVAGATRFQLAYGRYYQFLTLETSELFTGFDTWLMTDDDVPPAYGDQFVAGVKTGLGGSWRLDVEGYYRTMRDLFEQDPFTPDVAGVPYAETFRFGNGRAYGGEVLLARPTGRLNGFVGYTLSRTERRFPLINLSPSDRPQYYVPKYDRTHDLNVVTNYELGKNWALTGAFNYATGQAYTEPAFQYTLVDDPFSSNRELDVLISPFNAERLPAYHRLDLGLAKTGRFFGFADYEFQFQVINAYARENIWFYFFEFEEDGTTTREEVPQIPVPIPNLSLSLRF